MKPSPGGRGPRPSYPSRAAALAASLIVGAPGSALAAPDVTHYDLALSFEPADLSLSAQAGLTVVNTPGDGALSEIQLDLVGLTVDGVTAGGQAAPFTREGGALTVTLPAPLASGASLDLQITYHGIPQPYPTDQGDLGVMQDRDITYAINVTEGARYWFPCRDRLDDKATVDLSLDLPQGNLSAGPGHLVSVSPNGPSREIHRWSMAQEVTPYLLSFAFSSRYQRREQEISAPAGDVHLEALLLPSTLDTAQLALDTAPDIVRWLTDRYGPFPFDQVGLHEIPFPGAVEQPGNIAVGGFYWAEDPRLLIYFAHELSHSWFQGKVTIRTWDDVWLSEGAAAWHEILWTEQMDGLDAADAQAAVYIDAYRVGIVDEGSFPLGAPELVFGFTTYMKGPTVWRLLEHLAGREALLEVLAAYLDDADGVADLDDFFAALSALDAPGLSAFRREWIDRAGLPDYRFGYEIGPSEGRTGVMLQLSQPAGRLYTTPIDVVLDYEGGREEVITLSPTSADSLTYVCRDEAPLGVRLDPRRMVPAAPAGPLSRLEGVAADACLVEPPPAGCDSRGEGLLPLLGLLALPAHTLRRRRR